MRGLAVSVAIDLNYSVITIAVQGYREIIIRRSTVASTAFTMCTVSRASLLDSTLLGIRPGWLMMPVQAILDSLQALKHADSCTRRILCFSQKLCGQATLRAMITSPFS